MWSVSQSGLAAAMAGKGGGAAGLKPAKPKTSDAATADPKSPAPKAAAATGAPAAAAPDKPKPKTVYSHTPIQPTRIQQPNHDSSPFSCDIRNLLRFPAALQRLTHLPPHPHPPLRQMLPPPPPPA